MYASGFVIQRNEFSELRIVAVLKRLAGRFINIQIRSESDLPGEPHKFPCFL